MGTASRFCLFIYCSKRKKTCQVFSIYQVLTVDKKKTFEVFWKPQRSKKRPLRFQKSSGSVFVLGTLYFVQLRIFLRHPRPLILIQVDFSHTDGFWSDFKVFIFLDVFHGFFQRKLFGRLDSYVIIRT